MKTIYQLQTLYYEPLWQHEHNLLIHNKDNTNIIITIIIIISFTSNIEYIYKLNLMYKQN